jgi:hypothetical protein
MTCHSSHPIGIFWQKYSGIGKWLQHGSAGNDAAGDGQYGMQSFIGRRPAAVSIAQVKAKGMGCSRHNPWKAVVEGTKPAVGVASCLAAECACSTTFFR